MLAYIDSLQKKNAEALSFYPKCVFEREHLNGRLFLGLLNGEPCGYIYVGAPPHLKCHQVCIQYDARRRLYGAALVAVMEDHARETGSMSITLRCGFDLDANSFWRELGYACVNTIDGGIRRMRRINIWKKHVQVGLFELIHSEPERGNTSATFWRNHKQTGIITQFHRGKSLRDYRAILTTKEGPNE